MRILAAIALFALVPFTLLDGFGSPSRTAVGRLMCDCHSPGFETSHLRRTWLIVPGVLWLIAAVAIAARGGDVWDQGFAVFALASAALGIHRWLRHPEDKNLPVARPNSDQDQPARWPA